MLYRILADVVVGLHLLFVVFAVCGGFLALRWPRVAWIHVPTFLWAGIIEIFGWVCPLTYVENDLRAIGAAEGYPMSFVERYLVPVLYPEMLFSGDFPESGLFWIGVFVLALNALIYWRVARRFSS